MYLTSCFMIMLVLILPFNKRIQNIKKLYTEKQNLCFIGFGEYVMQFGNVIFKFLFYKDFCFLVSVKNVEKHACEHVTRPVVIVRL